MHWPGRLPSSLPNPACQPLQLRLQGRRCRRLRVVIAAGPAELLISCSGYRSLRLQGHRWRVVIAAGPAATAAAGPAATAAAPCCRGWLIPCCPFVSACCRVCGRLANPSRPTFNNACCAHSRRSLAALDDPAAATVRANWSSYATTVKTNSWDTSRYRCCRQHPPTPPQPTKLLVTNPAAVPLQPTNRCCTVHSDCHVPMLPFACLVESL